ncbi:hypothetical protein KIW84_054323 [Lathyrus oleraceus]|uniref:Uncharacterized protein n=1 Tax=Pisum sativum TaxID=3888 RepID=A0A9D5AHB7_PEA|nr:hypothetical protein KIW84_054323 [Pisum sativum]
MFNSSLLLGAHRSATQTVLIRTSLTPLPLPNGQSLVSPAVTTTTQPSAITEQSHVPLPEPEPANNAEPLRNRYSTRVSHPPSYLEDYHYYNTIHHSPNSPNTKPKPSNVAYPLSSVLSYDNCSPSYKHYFLYISSHVEPKTFNQANKHDCWKKAMDAELIALEEKHTWQMLNGLRPILELLVVLRV